ncbi:hypothetical protein SAMN05421539_1152 [Jannaschia seohaensis]|uniref:Secreted protein n=2 Tax=Jannaschia seohaensis TaxID=475081 RepID=A0A2Y9B2C3_9RHOB|nr:hypothetical protein BCF38_1152 [Jannaschia seohaensis]SSA50674.1 hypothetical protein SAMN05421539_1152 [Jannaschia seohaensis]
MIAAAGLSLLMGVGAVHASVLSDGSFEAGTPNPSWTEFSANFGTPLCTIANCGTGNGSGPRTGDWWAWFGGVQSAPEASSLSQTVVLPTGSATLRFYFETPALSANPSDFIEARMNGTTVWSETAATATSGLGYSLVSVDISAYADGGSHTLSFFAETTGNGVSNFFIDDVSIETAAVPLPPAALLLGGALLGGLGLARRRPRPRSDHRAAENRA